MKIQTKLIVAGIVPLTIMLIVVLVVHVGKMSEISNNWADRVRIDMIENENNTLSIRTEGKANLSRLMFGKSIYNIELLMTFASFVSTIGFMFDYPLFYNVPPVGTSPGPLGTSIKDPRLHSSVHSGWFNRGINDVLDRTSYEAIYSNLSNMDNIFYPLYESNDDYLNVYHGKQSNGHYQSEPYTQTNFDTLALNSYPDGAPFVGYDPTRRYWYYEAFNNGTKTILTDPYNDALTNKVLITMARRVDDEFPSQGVWGLDIYLDQLSQSITGGKILDNGQFYIVSTQGIAVLYDGIDLNNVELFADVLLTDNNEKISFASTWNTITTTDKFSGTFTKNGEVWYISTVKVIPDDLANNGGFFANIDVSNVDIPYIIVAVVPESDIEKASIEIKKEANDNVNTSLAINVVVIILFIIATIFFFWKLSNRIVEPIVKFEKMMSNIQAGDLEANLSELDEDSYHTSSDVSSLANSINQLFLFLRAGNNSYWGGDMKSALVHYDEVERVTGNDNKRIMGSLENNRGAANQQLTKFREADAHYNNAIKYVEQLIAENSDNEGLIVKLRQILRNRKMNLASLGIDILKNEPQNKDIQDAVYSNIKEVIDMCSSAEDMIGLAKSYGIMGRYNTILNRTQEAERNYVDAYNIIKNDPNYQTQWISLEYTTYNLAEYYANIGNDDQALELCGQFNERTKSKKVPTTLFVNFIRLQLNIAEKRGMNEFLDGLHNSIQHYPELENAINATSKTDIKYLDFTIDVSGSMGGSRINAVASSLRALHDNIINPDDMSCITSFNGTVNQLTWGEYRKKSDISHLLTRSGHAWNVGGMTAFFEAIWRTLDRISNLQKGNPTAPVINVFILTDGSDTVSSKNIIKNGHRVELGQVIKDINQLIHMCRINLIIFTIGNDYNRSDVRQFIESANKTVGCFGIHLEAGSNIDDIMDKFKTVEKIMNNGEINIESFA